MASATFKTDQYRLDEMLGRTQASCLSEGDVQRIADAVAKKARQSSTPPASRTVPSVRPPAPKP